MGVCALTGNHGKFVKSHLYPQAFYDAGEDGAPFKIIGSDTSRPPKSSWTGSYDSELVTAEGEKLLADLDNYAAMVLMPGAPFEEFFRTAAKTQARTEKSPLFGEFTHFDVGRLNLFFASVLWRFGASCRPEANGTNLGPYLERFRSAIVDGVPPPSDYFGVTVTRIIDFAAPLVLTPAKYRADGVNMWRLVFGNYQIDVRCDRRRTPAPLSKLEMRAGEPVLIMGYEYTRSRSYRNTARLVQQSSRQHGWPWGDRWPRG